MILEQSSEFALNPEQPENPNPKQTTAKLPHILFNGAPLPKHSEVPVILT
jgi:hypothetical protein